MKPDPEIYWRSLARLDLVPYESIFVDDRLPNIIGARQLGMHTIKHTDTDLTIVENSAFTPEKIMIGLLYEWLRAAENRIFRDIIGPWLPRFWSPSSLSRPPGQNASSDLA